MYRHSLAGSTTLARMEWMLSENILKMYRAEDHNVTRVGGKHRHVDHLLCSFAFGADWTGDPACQSVGRMGC